jgi:hypothetical protein
VVDSSADGIAPHQPGIVSLQQFGRRTPTLNSDPQPIHNFTIFGENQGLWAASYSSKSLIFLACLH